MASLVISWKSTRCVGTLEPSWSATCQAMASPSRSGSVARYMVEAVLAAFLSSDSVLVLPLMVTYLGSKSRSTSTPSSRVGRSRRWPTVAFTSYPAPRYFPIVLALVGDSTITRALPFPARAARGLAAFTAPFLGAAGAASGLPVLAGDFTARLDLVAMSPLCLLGSSNGQFGGCKKSAPPGPRKAAISKCPKLNNLGAAGVPRARVASYHPPCVRASPTTSSATAAAALVSAD